MKSEQPGFKSVDLPQPSTQRTMKASVLVFDPPDDNGAPTYPVSQPP